MTTIELTLDLLKKLLETDQFKHINSADVISKYRESSLNIEVFENWKEAFEYTFERDDADDLGEDLAKEMLQNDANIICLDYGDLGVAVVELYIDVEEAKYVVKEIIG